MGHHYMASVVFVDIPAGTGFSYAKTKEAWISSDSIVANLAHDFVRKLSKIVEDSSFDAIQIWANSDAAQHALKISQGTIGGWELINTTMHYAEGKKDTFCYSYDIFSSFAYHKKLTRKNCRALIFSYEMTYAQNDFSLTFATVKGAGHLVPVDKPKECMDV
ncbi:hypothetical protein L1987_57095 [Smallanthus sonchifolius]|uniref:Uncharacterized protein n=1 Tax=Smallanthus sonchifolius TaxID=185202 RepID=A0ACB9DBL3_9ASTR|nr:hypothetical protein L1987_57095 [Smallanthus sonchifolius]